MVAPITARSPAGQPPGRYRERSRAEYAAKRNVSLIPTNTWRKPRRDVSWLDGHLPPRLKAELTQDALGRMFGEDGEKQVAPSHPHVILALANHAHTACWHRAKALRDFETAAARRRCRCRAGKRRPCCWSISSRSRCRSSRNAIGCGRSQEARNDDGLPRNRAGKSAGRV